MKLSLLRHGEARGGTRFRGSSDDPLTEAGWAQLRAAVEGLDAWDGIVTSPLRRCAAFAEMLAAERGLPLAVDERLREIHFGAWEGRSYAQLMLSDPRAVTRFFSDPFGFPPPDSEPLPDFRQRVEQALEDLLQARYGCHPLVITHGGVIRFMLCHARGWPAQRALELEVPHASLHKLTDDALWREADT